MFFEYLLNLENDEILNEDNVVIGDGKDKTLYRYLLPGHASSNTRVGHTDRRIKFGKGSSKESMITVAIDPNTRSVDMKHTKNANDGSCTVDDVKNVVFFTSALLAYDYDRFDSIPTSDNPNMAGKELMKDFNALPKSERDKYYKQGKESFNKYNKNVKWPR